MIKCPVKTITLEEDDIEELQKKFDEKNLNVKIPANTTFYKFYFNDGVSFDWINDKEVMSDYVNQFIGFEISNELYFASIQSFKYDNNDDDYYYQDKYTISVGNLEAILEYPDDYVPIENQDSIIHQMLSLSKWLKVNKLDNELPVNNINKKSNKL